MSQEMLITAAHLLPLMYTQCYKVIHQKMNILPLIVEDGIFLFQNPSFLGSCHEFLVVYFIYLFSKRPSKTIVTSSFSMVKIWFVGHLSSFITSFCPTRVQGIPHIPRFFRKTEYNQWSFLVPLIGGSYHIIPQLAVYTTYIPLIYCLLGDYISPTTY